MARGFCTAPPGLLSLETAVAVLRLTRDGVDQRQQQAVVLLLVGAAQRAADLQGHDVGVRRRLHADLLLQSQRHIAVDDELRHR